MIIFSYFKELPLFYSYFSITYIIQSWFKTITLPDVSGGLILSPDKPLDVYAIIIFVGAIRYLKAG